jgi:hypothetical protein
MAKKTKTTETIEEDVPTPAPVKEEKKEPEKTEPVKPEPVKAELVKPVEPKKDDDDVAFVKSEYQKQLIANLDADTLKLFVAECEGKSLKEKAVWVAAHKQEAPKPDPKKQLPLGGTKGGRLYEINDISKFFM